MNEEQREQIERDDDPFHEGRLQAAEDGDGREEEPYRPGQPLADREPLDVAALRDSQGRTAHIIDRDVPDFRGPGDLADPNRYADLLPDGGLRADDELEDDDPAAVFGPARNAPRVVDAGGPIVLHPAAVDEQPAGTSTWFDELGVKPVDQGTTVADEVAHEQARDVNPDEQQPAVDESGPAEQADDDATLNPTNAPDGIHMVGGDECPFCGKNHGTVEDFLTDLAGEVAAAVTPPPAEVDVDPDQPFNVVLGQVQRELGKMLDELATNLQGLVSSRSVHARVAGLRAAIEQTVYPTDRLVTADVIIRSDGEQFELQMDGARFPWALHADTIAVKHLATGYTVVMVPVLAHRVRLDDMRGRTEQPRPDGVRAGDGDELRDVGEEARAAHNDR